MDRLYTFNEAAQILSVKARTLRAWRQRGRFAVVRIGGSRRGLRIPQCELDRLVCVEIGTVPKPEPSQISPAG